MVWLERMRDPVAANMEFFSKLCGIYLLRMCSLGCDNFYLRLSYNPLIYLFVMFKNPVPVIIFSREQATVRNID